MKKAGTLLVLALLMLSQYAWNQLAPAGSADVAGASGLSSVAAAYEARQSDVQVKGSAEVIKVLADDNEGSRHQRFILRLDSQRTLLVAHNIDLAPRIPGLSVGDTVEFFGEYEWDARGGVIHWTHHDPGGRHVDGWLRHQGKLYQ